MVLRSQQIETKSLNSPTCRVISAEAKSKRDIQQPRYRIAGVLDVVGGGSHYAEVRDGVLVIHTEVCPTSHPKWKLPLRGLSLLQAKPFGLAFALASPSESSPITFQVGSEYEYEKWVKCLAVELMRQTPLDRVKFLDILGITGSIRRSRSAECVSLPYCDTSPVRLPLQSQINKECAQRLGVPQDNGVIWPSPQKHLGYNNRNGVDCLDGEYKSKSVPPDLTSTQNQTTANHLVYRKRNQQLPDVIRDLPPCSRRSRSRKKEVRITHQRARGHSLEPVTLISTEKLQPQVMELLLKCQRSDIYVPVKEKRLLFESLWKREGQVPRSQSLHDLSHHNLPTEITTVHDTVSLPCHDPKVTRGQNGNEEEVNQHRFVHISDKLSRNNYYTPVSASIR